MRYPISLKNDFPRLSRYATMRSSAGQSLVELALVFPLFLLLLVGLTELGRLAYIKTEVVNAARAGAAYASQNHVAAADITGIETAAQSDASNILSSLLVFSPAPSYFCACSSSIAPGAIATTSCSTAVTTCFPNPNHPVLFVQVNTQATVSTLFHYPGIPANFTLRGQSIMTVEQ